MSWWQNQDLLVSVDVPTLIRGHECSTFNWILVRPSPTFGYVMRPAGPAQLDSEPKEQIDTWFYVASLRRVLSYYFYCNYLVINKEMGQNWSKSRIRVEYIYIYIIFEGISYRCAHRTHYYNIKITPYESHGSVERLYQAMHALLTPKTQERARERQPWPSGFKPYDIISSPSRQW